MDLNWAIDGWIMVIGALCACACAAPGVFLVIRGQAMLADSISHAVLPGIAIGYLWSGTREGSWVFLGAAASALLASISMSLLERVARVERGASMGIVLSVFFAAGLVLIVQAADTVDLDPGCVLYGAIELAPLDVVKVLGAVVPRAVLVLVAVTLLNLGLVAVCFKELRIAAFDPALGRSMGCKPQLMDLLLMAMTAVTAVACFDSIGSVLFVAMLVAPAAAARVLSSSIWPMIGFAALLGTLAAALGHLAAVSLPRLIFAGVRDTSTAGMMALTCAIVFVLTHLLFSRAGRRAAAMR